jgi:ubiquinone/menaquinone biosynthesis C-methylase UbiE
MSLDESTLANKASVPSNRGTACPDTAQAKQTRAVNSFFGSASRTWANYYDGRNTTLSHLDLTVRLQVATAMVRAACQRIQGAIRLLDAGCGTGEGTSLLTEPRLHAFAIDLSAAMVGQAVRHHQHLRGSAANALALPFSDHAFDIVLSLGTLEYVTPSDVALREYRRVLKPGGTLVLSVPNGASWFRRLNHTERNLTLPLRRLRAHLRHLTAEEAGLAPTFRHQNWTPAEIERLLRECNFTVVDTRLMTYGWLLPMAETWPANLALCRWLNRHCSDSGWIAKHLACTAVLHARAV